jgi:hypothetical protein
MCVYIRMCMCVVCVCVREREREREREKEREREREREREKGADDNGFAGGTSRGRQQLGSHCGRWAGGGGSAAVALSGRVFCLPYRQHCQPSCMCVSYVLLLATLSAACVYSKPPLCSR